MSSLLLGPVLPRPSGLGIGIMNPILVDLPTTLHQTFQQGHSDFGDFMGNTSSVSITAMSTEDSEETPFFNFHFSSPFLNETAGSTTNITEDSVYRIGSISKLFTVYALLLNFGREHWDNPVTDYIPQLREAVAAQRGIGNPVDHVDWENITLGAMASQLSGIGRDYANGDLASQNFPWQQAGLPSLPMEDIPSCAGNTSLPPCNLQEYFQGFIQRHPVFSPETTPVYSNAAYRILGYVLETLSGTSYESLLRSSVLEPLNLSQSSTHRPESNGSWVIPNGDSGWFQDTGDEAPTAGMYSSSRDLAAFGQAILANKQLSALDTRRWMKPNSHTSSLVFSVGSPWEIWRAKTDITQGRVLDLYAKSGSIGKYNSLLILVPDYGVTVSILTAGPSSGSTITIAAELVMQKLLPALEMTSHQQACRKLCGTYTAADPKLNSSLVIVADDKNPGLLIKRWISRSVDMYATAQAFADETGGGQLTAIRLQQTNLESMSWGKRRPHSQETRVSAYRAVFETHDPGVTRTKPRIFGPDAHQWSAIDSLMYGEVAADDFVFYLDDQGFATAIEPRVLRETFHRGL
ncbi:penicillin-binding protein, putative [Talaromyces stipitatus ATCC 10500]|uniref:Penicillin-binding protein, putative n=1 Tax=Talaromyces stipitatus (strain ATCC 10500 / CBS 375.48 / QM 6759 / NRRL 1006) TaxID=441959 RepID=B8MM35_TALSN|nr:penicillin-binding protein, putative [Talaromyces stipitatus ATCC 10500]EED13547.1 penicillin-binding protein, putative [Talaromyces stipitatus ATCC 10500]